MSLYYDGKYDPQKHVLGMKPILWAYQGDNAAFPAQQTLRESTEVKSVKSIDFIDLEQDIFGSSKSKAAAAKSRPEHKAKPTKHDLKEMETFHRLYFPDIPYKQD